GIKEVLFFQGEPVNGRRPENVKPEHAMNLDDKKTQWGARLPLALEARGSMRITAEFVNGVDLSSFKTISLEFTDPSTTPAAKAVGSIEGSVAEGARAIPNLEVKLSDAKGNFLKSAMTDDAGKFTIADLAPGTYQVSAQNDNRAGQKTVIVTAGKSASVALSLFSK